VTTADHDNAGMDHAGMDHKPAGAVQVEWVVHGMVGDTLELRVGPVAKRPTGSPRSP
jgi:hypothetical protein